jgi:hypothetical protein
LENRPDYGSPGEIAIVTKKNYDFGRFSVTSANGLGKSGLSDWERNSRQTGRAASGWGTRLGPASKRRRGSRAGQLSFQLKDSLMKCTLVFASALGICAIFVGSLVEAAKPPPPPPPPSAGPEVYEWRPDLGGMLDTSTNLVWGCEFYALSGGTAPFNHLQSVDYPGAMLSTADTYYDAADYYYGIGDVATGDLYTSAAEACEDAATFTNWRFPTLAEAQDAMAKSLFKYDIEGFSGYWATPLGPGIAYDGFTPCWTSTLGKNNQKINGFPTTWTYTPATGATGLASRGWSADAIWVRTHVP